MLARKVVYLFALALLTACASASGTSGPRRDNNMITQEELEPLGPGVSAREAIERLRPIWLRDRGTNSPNPAFVDDTMPKLMIDRAPQDLEALRSLRTNDIQTMRFISATDATTLYGTGYTNGLIEVITRNNAPTPPRPPA
jgi:hypothetical protein